MSKKEKNTLLSILIVGVVIVTIIFATFTRKPAISNNMLSENNSNNWDVSFNLLDSGSSITILEYASLEQDYLTFNPNSTIITLPHALLKAPGDKVIYKWNVKNKGDINAILTGKTDIKVGNIIWNSAETLDDISRKNLINDIEIKFTYADGTDIKIGDKLEKNNGTRELMVTIEYVRRDEPQVLPSHSVHFNNITAVLIYGQDYNN